MEWHITPMIRVQPSTDCAVTTPYQVRRFRAGGADACGTFFRGLQHASALCHQKGSRAKGRSLTTSRNRPKVPLSIYRQSRHASQICKATSIANRPRVLRIELGRPKDLPAAVAMFAPETHIHRTWADKCAMHQNRACFSFSHWPLHRCVEWIKPVRRISP